MAAAVVPAVADPEPAVPPTPQEVRDWANVSTQSLTDDQLQQIIDAEVDVQGEECAWLEAYPVPLQQSLLRRCAREIAARQLPLGLTGDSDGEYAPTRLPNYDAEINRLERRWRRPAFA